ncbi:MAG: DHHW family protein [Gudongella sp.]|nr:DHHW family protein [Gudongella sp.]
MKDKIRLTLVSLFMVLVSILNLLVPSKSFSNTENRYLQLLPEFGIEELFSGEYAESFQIYSTDQFPFRDFWIRLKTAADLVTLKKDNGRVYFGKDDFLFEVEPPFNLDIIMGNIGYILEFADSLEERETGFNVVLIPSKEAVLDGFLPDYAPVPDESLIFDTLKDKSGEAFKVINLLNVLKNEDDEYIYYKTDHHWTSYGAYKAYSFLGSELGFEPLGMNDFKKLQVANDFLGAVYRKANLYTGTPDTMEVYKNIHVEILEIKIDGAFSGKDIYYGEYLDSIDKYSYFFGGDHGVVDIETTSDSGKELLIVKDSFSNSFVPFLLEHYSRLVMVDPRHLGGDMSELIEEINPDEVLLMLNTENIAYSRILGVLAR